jgi:PAS domain S-box-containing protein
VSSPVSTVLSDRELLERIVGSMQQAVIATDLDGRIEYWSRGAERLYGWTACEVVGRNIIDVTPSTMSRAQAVELMERLSAGESWSGEFDVKRKDGETFRVLVTDSPIYDSQGRLSGIVGVSIDLGQDTGLSMSHVREKSHRRRVEAGLQFLVEASRVLGSSLHPEATLQTLAALAVPFLADFCLIYIGNGDGVVDRVVGAHADPGQDALLQIIAERHKPDPRNAGSPVVRALRTQRSSLHTNFSAEAMSGLISEAEVFDASLALDPASGIIAPLVVRGRALGVIALVRNSRSMAYDSADLELAEEVARRAAVAVDNAHLYEEAERARGRAETANRSKADFLAVLSHELRTPLNAIAGYLELLDIEVHGPLTTEQRAHVARLKANQHRLLAIIADVLDFAKLETGHVQFDIRPVALNDVLSGMDALVSPLVQTRGVKYTYVSIPSDVMVLTDRERLQQIVLNVLSNAVKFTPSRGLVTMTVETTEAHVNIVISDTGPGIPSTRLEAIFEPFFRVPGGEVRKVEGSGLGLAISRDLARAMGAQLTVSSTVGEGSAFTLRLPRA